MKEWVKWEEDKEDWLDKEKKKEMKREIKEEKKKKVNEKYVKRVIKFESKGYKEIKLKK